MRRLECLVEVQIDNFFLVKDFEDVVFIISVDFFRKEIIQISGRNFY